MKKLIKKEEKEEYAKFILEQLYKAYNILEFAELTFEGNIILRLIDLAIDIIDNKAE